MCSIIISKINKNLVDIVREYLLPEKEYSKIVKIRTYHSEISNIKSQYLYLQMKRKNIVVDKSNYYFDTLVICIRNDNFYETVLIHMNIYDFPYQDICKIKDQKIRNELYNKKLWTNYHILD